MSNRHRPDAMQVSSLQAGLLSTCASKRKRRKTTLHCGTNLRHVVMSLSSLLAGGFVWLQRCSSQKGHPAFVVKAEKAAGSAQQSQQQAKAAKRRSDQAIPAI